MEMPQDVAALFALANMDPIPYREFDFTPVREDANKSEVANEQNVG
jgi:hypothetical protein